MSESKKGSEQPTILSRPEQAEAIETVLPEEAEDESREAASKDSLQEAVFAKEISSLEAEKARIENEWLRNELEEAIDLRALRQRYMPWLFGLIVAWLVVVVVFLTLAALGKFVLTDTVLVAFITSTTASVIGLFVIAARWLFRRPTKPPFHD